VLVVPVILLLAVQYLPLFAAGLVPFVGPGGMFVAFIGDLFPMLLILSVAAVISTWFYQLTGTIYLGALLNALIVTWVFTSSQVIAPIPV
jgi:hypothetical protein